MTAAVALRHEYEPRGSVQVLLECRDPEVLVSGPAGTGKSRGCLEKMLMCALLNPGMRGLIVRKTHISLTSTTLVTWREHVAVEALAGGLCVYYGGSASEPAQFRFRNGSKILLAGMDKPTKIMSSEFDLVYVGEATELTPTDWDMLSTRARNGRMSFQQIIADCNPDRPTHWLKSRCDDGTTTILYSAHWENPRIYAELPPDKFKVRPELAPGGGVLEEHNGKWYHLTPQGVSYIGRLDALTGVRKQRLRYGIWAAAEGLVYENWDPTIHLIPRGNIPPEWARFWVIDFGYKNPFVCQWWAETPDGQLIRYREIYMSGRIVEDHARAMLRAVTRYTTGAKLTRDQVAVCKADPVQGLEHGWLQWVEPEPAAIICDHDAEGRATLAKHLGRGTTAARKTVTPGIQAVEARLKVAGDGKPGLVLMADSLVERDEELKTAGKPVCTEDEFGSYIWEPPKDGRGPKEEPRKEHDHGLDCVRYVVAHRDLRLRIRDREIGLEG